MRRARGADLQHLVAPWPIIAIVSGLSSRQRVSLVGNCEY